MRRTKILLWGCIGGMLVLSGCWIGGAEPVPGPGAPQPDAGTLADSGNASDSGAVPQPDATIPQADATVGPAKSCFLDNLYGGLVAKLPCDMGEFCAVPEAQCGGKGECKLLPSACPDIYAPVCGCNGKTYGNSCEAAGQGINVKAKGACPDPGPGACKVGDPAGCPGGYCATGLGLCGGEGQCAPQPQACTEEYAPVCGCDGQTYGNKCNAAGAGVNVQHLGACEGPQPLPCTVGLKATCPEGQFCAVAAGLCSGSGQCQGTTMACDMMYAPVCGCDGKTYGNACEAGGLGVNVLHDGECKPSTGCKIGVPDACGPNQYCAAASSPGQCGGEGKCSDKPMGCTKEYKPVCGCDGQTYGNVCMAMAAGANIAANGACQPTPGACKVGNNAGCAEGQYCSGVCGGEGTCQAKPQACTMQYDPVCGCDGKTYGNGCSAAGAGASVKSKGECSAVGPCDASQPETCGQSAYCAVPSGKCGGPGACAKKPEACITLYAPVCGCDGKTYGNDCEAAGAGQNVATKGQCEVVSNLKWFYTCGAPVCAGWKPQADVPLCSGQKAGDPCKEPGQACDPKDECNRLLKCADKDPRGQMGGCPISKREYKSDIQYLDRAEAQRLADALLQTRLATYRYTEAGAKAPRHLGFIIEDQPGSPAVDSRRDMVDLYGYLSMSVATLQLQSQRIESLERELNELRAQVSGSAGMCK